jgi:predicted nucleic acid-binding protein
VASSGYVIDTSVLVRWFLRQSGWKKAQKYRDDFIAGMISLETVECARFELPHVLRKKGVLEGKLTRDEYRAAVRVIDDLGIHVEPLSVDAIEDCAVLSLRQNMQFFDSVFLHRAIATDLPLLTADRPLANIASLLDVDVVVVRDEC